MHTIPLHIHSHLIGMEIAVHGPHCIALQLWCIGDEHHQGTACVFLDILSRLGHDLEESDECVISATTGIPTGGVGHNLACIDCMGPLRSMYVLTRVLIYTSVW